MGTAPVFASASEALEMARAALGYLTGADAVGMAAEEQAGCLDRLARVSEHRGSTHAGSPPFTGDRGCSGSSWRLSFLSEGRSLGSEFDPTARLRHFAGNTHGRAENRNTCSQRNTCDSGGWRAAKRWREPGPVRHEILGPAAQIPLA